MKGSVSYDAIIVGSGAGGAAAAYRLTLRGLKVLLLEKGAPLPRDGRTLDIERVVASGEFLSREPWLDGDGRRFAPDEHFNVGGKTKWYGAAVLRFSAAEFAADEARGYRGWPIGHEDLEPYYAQAEELLGVRIFDCEPDLRRILDDLGRIDPHWQSTPLPLALSPQIGGHAIEARRFDGFASAAGLKGDAETSFLSALTVRPNFSMIGEAVVVQLLPSSSSALRVAGVRLADGREFFAEHVVLAAGALHSPRLLEGYLARQGIGRELPCATSIGRHLKMHLLTAMISVSAGRKTDLLRKTMLTTHRDFPHSSVQALGFDAELIGRLVPRWVPRRLAGEIGRRAYGFFLQTEDSSHPDNRVRNTEIPTLDYRRARMPAAFAEHRAFTRALRRDLLRCGFLSFTQPIGLNGTAHVCGTLLAGADPSCSVVNAEGAVHGMTGLYVVDGSVLPRSSRVNPSLTIFAWALRVAEKLGEEPSALASFPAAEETVA
jgi:choline dehydrogenase-like flavoprotein